MVLAGVNGVKFGVNRSLKVSLTGVNTVLIGVNLVTAATIRQMRHFLPCNLGCCRLCRQLISRRLNAGWRQEAAGWVERTTVLAARGWWSERPFFGRC